MLYKGAHVYETTSEHWNLSLQTTATQRTSRDQDLALDLTESGSWAQVVF